MCVRKREIRCAQAKKAAPAVRATTATNAWPAAPLGAAPLVFSLVDETGAAEAAAARADEAMLPDATKEGTVAVETGARDGL